MSASVRWVTMGVLLLAACRGDPGPGPAPTDAATAPAPEPSGAAPTEPAAPRSNAPEPSPEPPNPADTVDPTGDLPPDEPETEPARSGVTYPLHGVAFHFLAHIFAGPSVESPIVGYMRRGSQFRAAEPVEGDGCEGGWHALVGDGFACRARGYLFGTSPRRFSPSPVPPTLEDPLPYAYARVIGRRVPQYWRIPTTDEEAATEAWLEHTDGGSPLVHAERASADAGTEVGVDEDGTPEPPDVVRLRMRRGFHVSVDRQGVSAADDEDRIFTRTVRGTYVPEETLAPVTPPPGRGVRLGGRHQLPVAFVYRRGATRFRLDPATGQLAPAGTAELGTALDVRARMTHRGRAFLVARDGTLVREHVVRVARARARPSRVPEGGRWLHVSLADQTLVAYEGDRPVFATVVSSGRPGFETPTGLYRIFSKHVTDTMDDLVSEEPYLIEDVPWVMYFERSYALHGTFWHEGFGRVRSHGCINLAPADAQWVFRWSAPSLPPAWHGVEARAGRNGTPILVEEDPAPPLDGPLRPQP